MQNIMKCPVLLAWGVFVFEEVYARYSSPNVIRVIKSRRMRCAGHVACMGDRSSYTVWWWDLKGKGHLQDIDVDGTTALKWIFKKRDGRHERPWQCRMGCHSITKRRYRILPGVRRQLFSFKKFYALTLNLYFNFNLHKFNNSNHQLTVIKI
jgi:hypothetical protein